MLNPFPTLPADGASLLGIESLHIGHANAAAEGISVRRAVSRGVSRLIFISVSIACERALDLPEPFRPIPVCISIVLRPDCLRVLQPIIRRIPLDVPVGESS